MAFGQKNWDGKMAHVSLTCLNSQSPRAVTLVYQNRKQLPTSFDSFGHCIARLLRVTSLTCQTHTVHNLI